VAPVPEVAAPQTGEALHGFATGLLSGAAGISAHSADEAVTAKSFDQSIAKPPANLAEVDRAKMASHRQRP
jgi:hypothetical protein